MIPAAWEPYHRTDDEHVGYLRPEGDRAVLVDAGTAQVVGAPADERGDVRCFPCRPIGCG